MINKQVKEALIGGFIATIAMLIVFYLEQVTRTFEINQPEFIKEMISRHFWGWIVIQFIAGGIFALFYSYFFNRFMAFISTRWLRGLVYGILLAVLVEIGISMTDETALVDVNLTIEIIGLILAYGTYGIVLGAWVENPFRPAE